MSDDDGRTEARAKLDQAVREYAQSRDEDEGYYVTGWQITIGSIRSDGDGESNGMLYETAPGQAWYATVGLSTAASDHYRGISYEGDED